MNGWKCGLFAPVRVDSLTGYDDESKAMVRSAGRAGRYATE